MTGIKRYQEYSYGVEETSIGEFVKYDDHAAIVAAKDARIAGLASREQWHSQRTASFDTLNRKYIDLQKQVWALAVLAEERREFIVNGAELGRIEMPVFNDDPATAIYQRCLLNSEFAAASVIREIRAQAVELASRKLRDIGDKSYAVYELECLAKRIRSGEQP